MSLVMTKAERESFLADLHVGVVSIEDPGRGPLTAPIWYAYEPGGAVTMLIGPRSRKAKLLEKATRASLVAQTETAPYKYVSVEGPVSISPKPPEGATKAMAIRYLGPEMGARYAAGGDGESLWVTLTPERWLTTDYGKRG
ncbi:MAG: pyridoxamine 5'-phosphate oxidase family protein [Dehalococcoidia bacterium]